MVLGNLSDVDIELTDEEVEERINEDPNLLEIMESDTPIVDTSLLLGAQIVDEHDFGKQKAYLSSVLAEYAVPIQKALEVDGDAGVYNSECTHALNYTFEQLILAYDPKKKGLEAEVFITEDMATALKSLVSLLVKGKYLSKETANAYNFSEGEDFFAAYRAAEGTLKQAYEKAVKEALSIENNEDNPIKPDTELLTDLYDPVLMLVDSIQDIHPVPHQEAAIPTMEYDAQTHENVLQD